MRISLEIIVQDAQSYYGQTSCVTIGYLDNTSCAASDLRLTFMLEEEAKSYVRAFEK